MSFFTRYIVLGIAIFTILLSLLHFTTKKDFTDDDVMRVLRKEFYTWHECIMDHLHSSRNDVHELWKNVGDAAATCEKQTVMSDLRIMSFKNRDKEKYYLVPLQRKNISTIISIGLNQDVSAERQLKLELGTGNAVFHGSDPIAMNNTNMYKTVGSFYPFAVGDSTGNVETTVFFNNSFVKKTVPQKTFPEFLLHTLQPSPNFIDLIWIDNEGGEYRIMPFLHKSGELDANNITICQFYMEIHASNDEDKEVFRQFIDRIMFDHRYIFVKTTSVAGHYRMFFINFDNILCARKYLINVYE